jgi:photosystem II stability/assembly factor-like uncharacterized protein
MKMKSVVAACAVALVSIQLYTAGATSAAGDVTRIEPVTSGTMHQALFGIALFKHTAIAVGAAGEILESSDRGHSWKMVNPAPTQLSLLGVSVQQGSAIAVGQEGLVLVMNDAGKWMPVDSGTSNRLLSVSANSRGLAAVAGAFGTILVSDDGGQRWRAASPDWATLIPDGAQPHMYAVNVSESGVIEAVGEFGLIIKSSDRGEHWSVCHKGEASLFALQVLDDGSAYAVGQSGTVLQSRDGTEWEPVDTGTTSILLGVHASATGDVVVTGMHDMLVSPDRGKSWTHAGGEAVGSTWYQGVAGVEGIPGALAVGQAGQISRVIE